jgi:hypothetical protein
VKDDDEYAEQKSLTEEVESGDTRRSLIALRDYVAHELEGNRCQKCAMSQLRTGDTAALVLRLQKIIEDIAALPPDQDEEAEANRGVVNLASIRKRRDPDRRPAPKVSDDSGLGTKAAKRVQGGRQPRFRGD